MMDTLINTKTNNVISSNDIVSSSGSGIVVSNKNCWKYIPTSDIKTETTHDDKKYYKYEEPIEIKQSTKVQDYHTKNNKIISAYVEKASCRFGFKNLKFGIQNINKSCYLVSNYIDLKSYSYITIASTMNNMKDWISEFYIIDGIKEVPIVNIENSNKAIKEKLFYMLPTLFSVDRYSIEPVLYQNNKKIDKNYLELSSSDFNNNEYVLEYLPAGDNVKYVPDNKQVKIKVVLRYIGNDEPKITNDSYCSVILNKHGGAAEWN